jgi:hypothetical protein
MYTTRIVYYRLLNRMLYVDWRRFWKIEPLTETVTILHAQKERFVLRARGGHVAYTTEM